MTAYNTKKFILGGEWGKLGGNKNSVAGTKIRWEKYRKYKKPSAVYCQVCSEEAQLEPVYVKETDEILQVCEKCRE